MSFVDAPFGSFANKVAEPTEGGRRRSADDAGGAERVKRTKLKAYDAAAAQMLNPYGPSIAKNMSLRDVWRAVAEGSMVASFHSELAATESTGGVYRVGVGISRIAESLLAAIHALEDPALKRLLQDRPLTVALGEGKGLEKALVILNAGKGSESTDTEGAGFGKFRSAVGQATSQPNHSEEAVRKAAADLYAWLTLDKSPLRAMLALLSCHGVFYAAQVNEKVARGWVHHKPAELRDVEAAALARRARGGGSSGGASVAEDDSAGLV